MGESRIAGAERGGEFSCSGADLPSIAASRPVRRYLNELAFTASHSHPPAVRDDARRAQGTNHRQNNLAIWRTWTANAGAELSRTIAKCPSVSRPITPGPRLIQGSTGDSSYEEDRLTVRCCFALVTTVFPVLPLVFRHIEMYRKADLEGYVLDLLSRHGGDVVSVAFEKTALSICATSMITCIPEATISVI